MKARQGTTARKARRVTRRRVQPHSDRAKEEKNRRRALKGGRPNELGITQGQNAEQGNTIDPEQARPLGKLSH
jgi:hypothetical protein